MPALKSIVKRTAAVADRVAPPPAGVTILIYHRVGGGSDSDVDLPVEQFEQQLDHLTRHHRVISLDQAVAELTAGLPAGWATSTSTTTTTTTGSGNGDGSGSDGESVSGDGSDPASANVDVDERRPVVITFDDGTADFTEHAVLALVRHGLPATLYVATQFVESGEPFPWGAPPASWSALRDAAADASIDIGSHTHAHWLMDRLDPAMVDADLDRSIELIGEHIGTAPAHFAYPKAVVGSPSAEVAVRRRFRSAALATSRVNRVGRTDAHRLWRTPVQRSDDHDTFVRKADGGLRLEGELRWLVARARYRGAEQ
jgi:peptidoglycan/xylan/chitin deacetylase (PgdA/CDA1 family)